MSVSSPPSSPRREGGGEILEGSFGSLSSPRRAATLANTRIIRRTKQEAPKTSGFVSNEILDDLEESVGLGQTHSDFEMDSMRSGGSTIRRGQSTLEATQEIAEDIRKDVTTLLQCPTSTTLSYMTIEAKLFLFLVIITIALTIVVCTLLSMYSVEMGSLGGGTVCVGHTYVQPTMNAMGYSIALQAVNCIFVMWYSVRSVRLEKSWTLLCYIIAAISQAGRAVYLAFGTLFDTFEVPSDVAMVSQALLTITAIILVATFPLVYRVHKGFGWRMYKKGATTAHQVSYMKRHYLMDTIVKVDLMVCVNAFTTMLFVVRYDWLRIAAGVVLGLTVAMLTVVTYFIKKRVKWFVYLLAIVCALMPALYIYFLVEQFAEPPSCIDQSLSPCLDGFNISVAYTNFTSGGSNDPATAATALHAEFPAGQEAKPPSWFVFSEDCVKGSNCYNTSLVTVDDCCKEYGQCEVHANLFHTERGLLVFLAVLGLIVRLLTTGTLVRRLREMDDVDVRELLQRQATRNIRDFALPLTDVVDGNDNNDNAGIPRPTPTTGYSPINSIQSPEY